VCEQARLVQNAEEHHPDNQHQVPSKSQQREPDFGRHVVSRGREELGRDDLGDRIRMIPDLCPCGSPLPTMGVEGRRDEMLHLPNAEGMLIPLFPMALSTVGEETPGVRTFQLIQVAPTTLRIRLAALPGMDVADVWTTVCHRLHTYLSSQGILSATLEHDPEEPHPHPVSGKYRQVWSEVERLLMKA
jgi:phenylacetate-CoA ligase